LAIPIAAIPIAATPIAVSCRGRRNCPPEK
jgi:hypothetical protein